MPVACMPLSHVKHYRQSVAYIHRFLSANPSAVLDSNSLCVVRMLHDIIAKDSRLDKEQIIAAGHSASSK